MLYSELVFLTQVHFMHSTTTSTAGHRPLFTVDFTAWCVALPVSVVWTSRCWVWNLYQFLVQVSWACV